MTAPSRTAPRKFVFDSMVVVPDASAGRFSAAHAPPAESASAMMAPPCRIPSLVHNAAAHRSVSATVSGV